MGGPNPSGIPTTDFGAINAWLQKKEYLAWSHESKPHASTGPHGGQVQTYVNPALETSLAAKAAEHPAGAASVKELYGDGSKLTGWAVMVKTQAKSEGGQGWYWYEVFDVAPGASGIGGQGSGTCTGCHARGADYVRIPFPLQ